MAVDVHVEKVLERQARTRLRDEACDRRKVKEAEQQSRQLEDHDVAQVLNQSY